MTLPLRNDKHYTYADYCTWDDSERWELIDGISYAMSPAPSPVHQRVSSRLHLQLASFLKGKPCEVFSAPFDVRLNADTDDDTVVQPDLLVVCDKSKLDDRGCNGAPDMVIEILSLTTARRDTHIKFQLYQQAGVREYWIVHPETKTVQTHVLENERYYTTSYADTDTIPVHVLDGCVISVPDVFA
jgi:Uma2 family endonuclease